MKNMTVAKLILKVAAIFLFAACGIQENLPGGSSKDAPGGEGEGPNGHEGNNELNDPYVMTPENWPESVREKLTKLASSDFGSVWGIKKSTDDFGRLLTELSLSPESEDEWTNLKGLIFLSTQGSGEVRDALTLLLSQAAKTSEGRTVRALTLIGPFLKPMLATKLWEPGGRQILVLSSMTRRHEKGESMGWEDVMLKRSSQIETISKFIGECGEAGIEVCPDSLLSRVISLSYRIFATMHGSQQKSLTDFTEQFWETDTKAYFMVHRMYHDDDGYASRMLTAMLSLKTVSEREALLKKFEAFMAWRLLLAESEPEYKGEEPFKPQINEKIVQWSETMAKVKKDTVRARYLKCEEQTSAPYCTMGAIIEDQLIGSFEEEHRGGTMEDLFLILEQFRGAFHYSEETNMAAIDALYGTIDSFVGVANSFFVWRNLADQAVSAGLKDKFDFDQTPGAWNVDLRLPSDISLSGMRFMSNAHAASLFQDVEKYIEGETVKLREETGL